MALGTDASAPEAVSGPPGFVDAVAEAGPPEALQAPEDAIERHLQDVLKVTQTQAGAVCLFDQHQELLRLAVEVGLSDEGCRRLRNVRRGSATTWDMPLHSLLNRRAYLIESAAKNRYVPPLVDNVAAVRAVACIPLCDGNTPVGSLILVALAPQTFGERQVRLLEKPVRELVGAIVAMRKRVGHAAPVSSGRPSLSRTSQALGSVTAAGPVTPGVQNAPAAPAAAPASVQAAVDRARADLERMRARIAEQEQLLQNERAKVTALEAAAARRAADLEAAAEREQSLLAASVRAEEASRERLAELEESHRSALAAAQAAHAATTTARETEHAAALSELATKLAEAEAARTALEGHVAELERGAGAEAREVADRIAAAVADADARATARIAELERLLAASQAARTEGDAELAVVHARHATTIAELEGRSAAALADAESRAAAALADARTAAPDALEAIRQERDWLRDELATTQAQVATLQAETTDLRAALEHAQTEASELRDGIAHLEALVQTSLGEPAAERLDADDDEPAASAAFEVVELGAAHPAFEGVIEASQADTAAPEAPTDGLPARAAEPDAADATAIASAPPDGLIILDTDTVWAEATPPKATVRVLDPTSSDLVRHLRERPAERLLVNLGAAHALDTLITLRAAGITTPCFGCIRAPNQPRALAVGRLEAIPPPLDPDSLLTALAGTFARGTRVVTAGADVDGLISLRQALSRLGASVSMAWDAKQVADLIAMVRPEVAIIDLDLPPRDGTSVVARLGLATPPPLAVVIPKASDCSAGFVAALAHPEVGRSTLPAKELLATVLGAPVARRA
jgi:CheY-like chemotaxis protein